MKNAPLSTAVIGDFHRDDFRDIIRHISGKTSAIYFDNLSLFLQVNALGQNFDLIFLLASSFAQFSASDVRRVQNRWPLARIVMISGSLTEGERRTGQLPSEMLRYYWHQWEIEALPAFSAFCDRRPSAWGLPPSASDEERLLKTVANIKDAKAATQPATAMIVASDPAMRNLLADWAKQQGYEPVVLRQFDFKTKIDCVIQNEIFFDVASENFSETFATVQFLKKQWPSAHLTVLYNAPRPDETRLLVQAGANRIVAKPFFIA